MTRVTIALPPRPYDAVIESGLLQRAGEKLREIFGAGESPKRQGQTPFRGDRGPGAAQVGKEVDGFSLPQDLPRKFWRCPTANATRSWRRSRSCRSN